MCKQRWTMFSRVPRVWVLILKCDISLSSPCAMSSCQHRGVKDSCSMLCTLSWLLEIIQKWRQSDWSWSSCQLFLQRLWQRDFDIEESAALAAWFSTFHHGGLEMRMMVSSHGGVCTYKWRWCSSWCSSWPSWRCLYKGSHPSKNTGILWNPYSDFPTDFGSFTISK